MKYVARVSVRLTTVVSRAAFVLAMLLPAGRSVAASFPFTTSKRNAQLKYPPLPLELQEKISGIRRKNTAPMKPDSGLSRDWALVNIGFFDVFSPTVQPLKSSIEACSPDVVVAVIDTGIDYTHPELRENIWVNHGETGAWEPPSEVRAQGISCHDKSCNGIDDDGNGYVDDVVGWDFVHDVPLAYDTHGHGTHIAGIISAAAANGAGSVGVCPRVSIMPLKYYDNSGAGYNNLTNTVRAIQYAVKNGAHIINYSGGGADPASTERGAIDEANKRGVLFIAAAGNDGHNNEIAPYYPASYPLDNIVGVASLNKQNALLPSSNFGKTVPLGAPGLMILSTLPEGKYGTMSGTSQATAFVTGAAAMLYSQMKVRGAGDFRRVKRWLVEGARPIKGNETKKMLSAGLLSLPRSLEKQREEMKRVTTPPAIAAKPLQAPVPVPAEVALRPGAPTTSTR